MLKAQQIGHFPVFGQQAPTLAMQSGTVPAVAPAQFDVNSIMNMMIMMMVIVMMMKLMTSATDKI